MTKSKYTLAIETHLENNELNYLVTHNIKRMKNDFLNTITGNEKIKLYDEILILEKVAINELFSKNELSIDEKTDLLYKEQEIANKFYLPDYQLNGLIFGDGAQKATVVLGSTQKDRISAYSKIRNHKKQEF